MAEFYSEQSPLAAEVIQRMKLWTPAKKKPRLRKHGSLWFCRSSVWWGYGESPGEAYRRWQMMKNQGWSEEVADLYG